MMDLRRIAHALGGEVSGRQVICPGPGHSRTDRSLSIKIDPRAPGGLLVNSFSGDDPIKCKDYVRERLGMPQWQPGDDGRSRTIPPSKVAGWDREAVEREVGDGGPSMTEDELLKIERATKIWNGARDPRATLAEKYLREHRKLDLPDDVAGTVLRFHPQCPWRDENIGKTVFLPALIAAFRNVDNDELTAIHRIALKPDGSKIGRRMLGVVRRAAVKLDSHIGDELVVGEGIETCMAARQQGVPGAVWALGSVGSITFFPVLPGINRLTILGEAGEASAQAIKACGTRWYRAGRRVRIARPRFGSDFNDELMGAQHDSLVS
jgi:putative DNA primase/helicase